MELVFMCFTALTQQRAIIFPKQIGFCNAARPGLKFQKKA
jgi:hypothetical protein